ncbi:MAG: hypothetical protein HC894_28935 [Microcoleus sp. SM1_3_4]|nr:hypothetical protein [Microcoleus sp. SM1_3_4]
MSIIFCQVIQISTLKRSQEKEGELPITNCQLSTVNSQLSTLNSQLSASTAIQFGYLASQHLGSIKISSHDGCREQSKALILHESVCVRNLSYQGMRLDREILHAVLKGQAS